MVNSLTPQDGAVHCTLTVERPSSYLKAYYSKSSYLKA